MPRVHFVKSARKAQPHAGIEVGDSYYWWKFRYGGKRVSKTQPSRSQLTQSQYYAAQYDAEDEAAEMLSTIADDVRRGEYDEDPSGVSTELDDVVQRIRDAGEENADQLEENAQSMEDGFGHETYQTEEMRERAESYRTWADDVETEAGGIDLSEFEEPESDSEDEDEVAEERDTALLEWREELASAIESIDVSYQGA